MLCGQQYSPQNQQHCGANEAGGAGGGFSPGAGSDSPFQRYTFSGGEVCGGKPEIVRNRFPVAYNPNTPKPVLWLQFLDGLLYPEDIPTLQEYIGYCLIPSNKGQRMMVIKGSGGEGSHRSALCWELCSAPT